MPDYYSDSNTSSPLRGQYREGPRLEGYALKSEVDIKLQDLDNRVWRLESNITYPDPFSSASMVNGNPFSSALMVNGSLDDPEFMEASRFEYSPADTAEWFPVAKGEEAIRFGDIVQLSRGMASRRLIPGSQRPLFVVSTRPALPVRNLPLLPERDGVDLARARLGRPLAFNGQVAVRVFGPVLESEAIVPSGRNDGTGVAVKTRGRADIVGFALVDSFPEDPSKPHLVLCLVNSAGAFNFDGAKAEAADSASNTSPANAEIPDDWEFVDKQDIRRDRWEFVDKHDNRDTSGRVNHRFRSRHRVNLFPCREWRRFEVSCKNIFKNFKNINRRLCHPVNQ